MQKHHSEINDPANFSGTYQLLRITYGVVPFLAGLDKFFNLLTNWEKYLPAAVAQLLPVSPRVFMDVVGVIEMIAGLAVLTILPRIGSLVVTAWLILVGLSAGLAGYFDITVRDFVMAAGAFTLAQIAARQGDSYVAAVGAPERIERHA
jgi:uncharacterized membrane protein YphA (DoxX/SURF4 family)